jgi:uncharacterized Zn finger protein
MTFDKITSSSAENLHDCLKNLSLAELRRIASFTICYRGQEYYEADFVLNFEVKSTHEAIAEVNGKYDDYEVVLRLENTRLEASCQCPYFHESGICKHIVATVLYAKEHLDEFSNAPEVKSSEVKNPSIIINKKVFYKQDLEALSKQEILALLFPREKSKNITKEAAENALKKAQSQIDRIFDDERYLYNAHKFEEFLQKQLLSLKNLWSPPLLLPLANYLLELMENIMNLMDEGYLSGYGEEWGETNDFEGDEFCEYTLEVISLLSFSEKMDWIERYSIAKEDFGYSNFQKIEASLESVFSEEDLKELKTFIFKKIKNNKTLTYPEAFYKALITQLSHQEKKIFVEAFPAHSYFVQEHLNLEKDNPRKQIEILENFLQENSLHQFDDYLIDYIKLLVAEQERARLQKLKGRIIQERYVLKDHLLFFMETFPEDSQIFMDILKNSSVSSFINFCIENDFLDEGLKAVQDVIKDDKDIFKSFRYESIFHFCAHFKKEIINEAKDFFTKSLQYYLCYPDKDAYQKITNCISELYDIEKESARSWLLQVRTAHKRKTSLMSMLEKMEKKWK